MQLRTLTVFGFYRLSSQVLLLTSSEIQLSFDWTKLGTWVWIDNGHTEFLKAILPTSSGGDKRKSRLIRTVTLSMIIMPFIALLVALRIFSLELQEELVIDVACVR
jgi:hypothetical protein